MDNAQRRMAESEIRLAEAKRAFDAAERMHHNALCRKLDGVDYRDAAADALQAARELSRVVGLHILTWDRLNKSNRGEAA
jgi:hypothetical protein